MHYAKAAIYLAQGEIERCLVELESAIGRDGRALGAPAALEFVFVTGLHQKRDRYDRALAIVDALDEWAQESVARPFRRNFAASAGTALILYDLGRRDDAAEQAKAAPAAAVATEGPVPGHPELGLVPELPTALMDRLIVIAGLLGRAGAGPHPRGLASRLSGRRPHGG